MALLIKAMLLLLLTAPPIFGGRVQKDIEQALDKDLHEDLEKDNVELEKDAEETDATEEVAQAAETAKADKGSQHAASATAGAGTKTENKEARIQTKEKQLSGLEPASGDGVAQKTATSLSYSLAQTEVEHQHAAFGVGNNHGEQRVEHGEDLKPQRGDQAVFSVGFVPGGPADQRACGANAEELVSGSYKIINWAHVSSAQQKDDGAGHLGVGAIVKVLQVVRDEDQDAIRAEISKPPGWISLKRISDGFTWAVKAYILTAPHGSSVTAGSLHFYPWELFTCPNGYEQIPDAQTCRAVTIEMRKELGLGSYGGPVDKGGHFPPGCHANHRGKDVWFGTGTAMSWTANTPHHEDRLRSLFCRAMTEQCGRHKLLRRLVVTNTRQFLATSEQVGTLESGKTVKVLEKIAFPDRLRAKISDNPDQWITLRDKPGSTAFAVKMGTCQSDRPDEDIIFEASAEDLTACRLQCQVHKVKGNAKCTGFDYTTGNESETCRGFSPRSSILPTLIGHSQRGRTYCSMRQGD